MFYQRTYLEIAFDSNFVESILKDSVVIDELIVVFGLPVDLVECNFAWVYDIDDLAVDCS